MTPAAWRAGWYSRRVRASAERGRVQGPGRAEADLGPRTLPAELFPSVIPNALLTAQQRFRGPLTSPRIGPPRGPLIPPLMGPPTPPLMGPPGGGGPGGVGLGAFQQVRTLAGQGHARFLRVTLPRYATLESARSIQRPSMGLLRRSTPGEIVEGGRFSRPCGPGALRAHLRKPTCGCAAIPTFLGTESQILPVSVDWASLRRRFVPFGLLQAG